MASRLRVQTTQYNLTKLPVSLAPESGMRGQCLPRMEIRQLYYTAPRTIAATNPNDRSVAMTFSLSKISIVGLSIVVAACKISKTRLAATVSKRQLGGEATQSQAKTFVHRDAFLAIVCATFAVVKRASQGCCA